MGVYSCISIKASSSNLLYSVGFGGSLSRIGLEIKHILKNENLSDDMIGISEKADRKLNMTQSHRIKSSNVTW